jgi:hypothetical protein
MLVIGWGEGLDDAGIWLNAYDQGRARGAVSAYTTGSFSYFYDHDVFTFASNLRQDWLEVDYAVTYANQWQRLLPNAKILEFFSKQTPVYVYSFRGLELAQVYDLMETLPPPNSEFDPERIIDFGGAILLLDFNISPPVDEPGESGEVALDLKNIQEMENNAGVLLRLIGPSGDEVWRSEGWPYGAPTSEWSLREVRRDAHVLALPATLPDGLYKLTLAFYDSDTLDPLRVSYPGNDTLPDGGDSADLALLQIGAQSPTPATDNPTWDFGETVRLADYTLPGTLPAGELLRFNLAWESLQATPNRYTVFVHVVDSSGKLVAQQDREPQSGFAPVNLWTPGMVLKDEYAIELPPDLPPDEYSVRIGLYDASGTRLPISDGDKQLNDAAELGAFRID